MHKKLDEVVQKIVNEVAPDRIILFGSRAKNLSSSRSDYDLAIDAGSSIDLEILGRIREKLDEIPILQKIDLLDLRSISSGFSEAISGELVVLDER